MVGKIFAPISGLLRMMQTDSLKRVIRNRKQESKSGHQFSILRQMRLHERAYLIRPQSSLQIGEPCNKERLGSGSESKPERAVRIHPRDAPVDISQPLALLQRPAGDPDRANPALCPAKLAIEIAESTHHCLGRPGAHRQDRREAGPVECLRRANTAMLNMDGPAPDAVNGKAGISSPTLQVKCALRFPALPFQTRQPSG